MPYALSPGPAKDQGAPRRTPMPGVEVPAELPPPSPLIGKAPPLPLSLPQWRRLQNNPDALRQMQSGLPLVGSQPAPAAAPPTSPWTLGPTPAGSPILSNPLLLTDGTVIAHVSCTGIWWKLTPDVTGSYVTGTWSQIASLPSGYDPRFFSSAVLPDGRVIIEGGEYNNSTIPCSNANSGVWTNKGAIYDPLANTWTAVTPPSGWTEIGDAQSTVLANGTYMQANCCQLLAALFNPTTLTWSSTGTGKFDRYDEEGWTLLPDGSVLTVDAYTSGTCAMNTERYTPGTGAWTSAGNTPSQLADCANPGGSPSFEMGPQVLRPDGTVVAFGGTLCSDVANSLCASGAWSVITPSAIFNSSTSTWAAGPDIPAVAGRNYSLADAPAVLLPNGNVLFAASPNYQAFVTPTHFFELSGTTNTIAQVADPTDAANFTSFQWNFLVLPTGSIMALETDGSNVWIYTNSPVQVGVQSGGYNTSLMPIISAAPPALVAGATYQVSGSQLNGLSQGAAYGDDQQAATNYPLVQIYNFATGHIFYARSFNHSAMSVAPNTTGSTNFTVPDNIESGPSLLYVLANGISGSPVIVNAQHSSYAKPADFNGDHLSDILWRNIDGTVVIWLMNADGSIKQAVGGQAVPNGWTIAGTGDFNGDGISDILWRCADPTSTGCTDGMVVIWLMNADGTIKQSVGGQVVPTGWTIVGTGNFNADTISDILWRCTDLTSAVCTDGTVVIWLMNADGSIKQSVGGQVVPTGWTIAGTGDFNADGVSDILWRCFDATSTVCTDGTVVIWLMNGDGTIKQSVGSQVIPTSWTIAGTGDFNADGISDILWRCTNADATSTVCTAGTVVEWLMNGDGTIKQSVGGQVIPTSWTIAGTGDFNGDGISDILWRCTDATSTVCTDGTVVEWLMNADGTIKQSVGGQVVSVNSWALLD